MLWSTIKFALSRMAFSLGSADYHNCLEGSTAHCVEQFQLWSIAICKLPSQTKVVIMSTNISPVIIEILFGSRVLFFFQGYISKITGVLQGAISKVIRHVHESSRFTQKKTLPFLLSRDERDFLQCPGSGETDKMDWVPCHCCMIQKCLITAG